MGLIGTVTPFKLMCTPNKVSVMIYFQNIKNIDFKELKTAVYVFSNMLNIKKLGKNPPEEKC